MALLPDARGSRLLARPARRLHHAARGRHVARPRRGAHRAGAAEPRRHARSHIGKTRSAPARAAVQRHLRVPRGAGRPARPAARRRAGQPPRRAGRRRRSTSPQSSRTSSGSPSGAAFGPSTQAIIDEAVSRDIPWIRLDRSSLVQLGQGVHQQRIRATMTSRTQRDRRRHRVGQGAHQLPAQRPPACPFPRREPCARDDERGRGRQRDRLPGAWSSRSTATTAAASASTCARKTTSGAPSPALRREPRRRRRRRDVRQRQRLPRAGHRRQDGRRRPARAGRRRRRRQAHACASWSTSRTPTRGAASATRRC